MKFYIRENMSVFVFDRIRNKSRFFNCLAKRISVMIINLINGMVDAG